MPVPHDQWRPGRSTSHWSGYAGTIGAFVKLGPKALKPLELNVDLPHLGLISASHVLAPLGVGARTRDYVLSPGPPDGKRISSNICGSLSEFVMLVRPSDEPGTAVVNEDDVALAHLENGANVSNYVPSPGISGALKPLVGYYTKAEVLELVENSADVFMVGFGSADLSRGRLEGISEEPVGLEIYPRNPLYYSSCLIVESMDNHLPFSVSGDSGALVYSEEIKAVGFVIGARGCRTYICPAYSSLANFDVELI